MRGPRGQASVEYMLLLCCCVTLVMVMGGLLKVYGPQLAQRMMEMVADAVVRLASP